MIACDYRRLFCELNLIFLIGFVIDLILYNIDVIKIDNKSNQLIGFILGTIEPNNNQLFVGDLNLDGIIDILDIVLIVNIIFE